MKFVELALFLLSCIGLLGVIALLALDKSIGTLLPVVTALIGAVIGLKGPMVTSKLLVKFRKKE